MSKYLHHSGKLSNMFICTNVLGQQFYLFITLKFISNMTPSLLANNSSHVIVGGVHADHLTGQTLKLPGKTFPENWIFIFITHYLLLMSSDHLYLDYRHGDGGDRISLHTHYTDTTQTSLHNVHHTTLPVKVSVTLRLRVTQSSIRATSPSIDCSLPDKKYLATFIPGLRKIRTCQGLHCGYLRPPHKSYFEDLQPAR